jgi:peptidoglycan/xylan/chitin deacetylase (PgdA/CDA1 family)
MGTRAIANIGAGLAFLLFLLGPALATECPGNPTALGTSRTIKIEPTEYPLVGTIQYMESLPLKDHEVVFTFDDGPVSPHTEKILAALAAECVKATFFMLGRNVAEAPDLARQAFDAGHTIGSHTLNHPHLDQLSPEEAFKDIRLGMAAVSAALTKNRPISPFFRFPYLDTTKELERWVVAHHLMVWSIDVDSEDWLFITPQKLVEQTINRLENAGKGILLMHDIQARTAAAMPALLAELKRHNFRIVQVVPESTSERATTSLMLSK